MVYKYATVYDWLFETADRSMLEELVKLVDPDVIDYMYHTSMAADDFYLDLQPCTDCGETDFNKTERTECPYCHRMFCDDCMESDWDNIAVCAMPDCERPDEPLVEPEDV